MSEPTVTIPTHYYCALKDVVEQAMESSHAWDYRPPVEWQGAMDKLRDTIFAYENSKDAMVKAYREQNRR